MQFVEIEDVVKRVGRRTFRLEVNPSNQNKEVRVLDTKTGKIKKITLQELYEKPIKPFYKTDKGVAIGDSYKIEDLFGKLLRILDLAFFVTPEYFLIYYKRNVYYQRYTYQKGLDISGFCYYALGVSFYTTQDILGVSFYTTQDILGFFLKNPYFVYEDIASAYLVDRDIGIQEFLKRAKIPSYYQAKVNLLYT